MIIKQYGYSLRGILATKVKMKESIREKTKCTYLGVNDGGDLIGLDHESVVLEELVLGALHEVRAAVERARGAVVVPHHAPR